MNNTWVKKLKSILIVERPELQGKWWHRLANVLIYASTVLFLVLCIFVAFDLSQSSIPYIPFSSHELSYIKFPLVNPNIPSEGFEVGDSDAVLNQMVEHNASSADIQAIVNWYGENPNGSYITKTDWKIFAFGTLIALPITFIWFFFWESIIYRAIVYVIYGKNKS